MKNRMRIYICCEKGKEAFYRERAEDIYKEGVVIEKEMNDAVGLVVAVQPLDRDMEDMIREAKRCGRYAVIVNENFVPAGLCEKLLKAGR